MAAMVLDSASASPPPQLRRSHDGRWVAGVCQGLARRWDLNVVQVRALFVLASVLAGLGVLAYVACWLVLPLDAGDDDSPSLVRGMASLALLAAAAAGLATIAAAAGATTLFGFGWLVAVAAAVFLVAALVAWPTIRPTWALAVLVAALVPAVAVAASGVRIAPQTGVEIATPKAPGDIPRRVPLRHRRRPRRPAPVPGAGRQRRPAAHRHGSRSHRRGAAADALLQPRRPLPHPPGVAVDEAAAALDRTRGIVLRRLAFRRRALAADQQRPARARR